MPLAGDYRNFDARRDKLDKGTFHGSWYTLLANLLELSRSEIEQRDHKRAARRRAITIGTVSGVIALLSIAFVVTLFAQREAVRQRDQAEHGQIVAPGQAGGKQRNRAGGARQPDVGQAARPAGIPLQRAREW